MTFRGRLFLHGIGLSVAAFVFAVFLVSRYATSHPFLVASAILTVFALMAVFAWTRRCPNCRAHIWELLTVGWVPKRCSRCGHSFEV
jgi:hypothetical protein